MAHRSNRSPLPDAIHKGAPFERLFYWLIPCLLLGPAWAGALAADVCDAGIPDRRVTVDYVIDGDTVILGDETHLRLIGLDTPEIDHDHPANTETGALEARRVLADLLHDGGPFDLVLDAETRDRHGRLLGHLFLTDGTNVQARLLARGLAVPLFFPPNLLFLDCYRAAAQRALTGRQGLWRLPQYRPLEAARLPPDTRGYRVVQGTVTRIGESRSSVWVNLGDGFAVRILRGDLPRFADPDPFSLRGQRLRVMGHVYQRNDQLRMRLRHPAGLFVLPRGEGNR